MSDPKYLDQWEQVAIGEIADVIAGGTPTAGDSTNFAEAGEGIAWLTPADLSGYAKKYIAYGKRDLSEKGYKSSSAKLMPAGSLVFSSRAPIGYVAIAGNPLCTNQGFKNFVFGDGVYPEFAYFYLKSIRELAESLGTGTTFKEISGATAKKLPFVLPPYAEQKAIADKLDTLLAQVETTKARLERIPDILKRFRQSVLGAVVSGQLKGLESELRVVSVEDIADSKKYSLGIGPFGSNLKVSDYRADGHPLVFVRDIRANAFGGIGTKHVNQEKFDELRAHRVLPGDIVITKMGDPPGDVALYPFDRPEGIITSDCIKLSVDESRHCRDYVAYAMRSDEFRRSVLSISAGVAQQKVNLKKFRKLTLKLPRLEEQTEIVRRVDQLFAQADRIEQQAQAALERVNKLTQSILAKAFRGELTEQWRRGHPELITGENSAAALLERIKAERGASPKKGRRTAHG